MPIYSEAQVQKDLWERSDWVSCNFQKARTTGSTADQVDEVSGPVTRSSIDEDDDLLLNDAAFLMEATDRRRLSRVPMEHITIAKDKTKFLLLVQVCGTRQLTIRH